MEHPEKIKRTPWQRLPLPYAKRLKDSFLWQGILPRLDV